MKFAFETWNMQGYFCMFVLMVTIISAKKQLEMSKLWQSPVVVPLETILNQHRAHGRWISKWFCMKYGEEEEPQPSEPFRLSFFSNLLLILFGIGSVEWLCCLNYLQYKKEQNEEHTWGTRIPMPVSDSPMPVKGTNFSGQTEDRVTRRSC